jgi:kynurenine formamidase
MKKFPFRFVDLTHTLDADSPTWGGECGFQHFITLDYSDCDSDVKFLVQNIKMNAGVGTHMDAPAHCTPGGATIDQLTLEQLIAPCYVIDVSDHADDRYQVSPDDLELFEKNHGIINGDSIVLIQTGWEKYWHDPDQYRNKYNFPTVSKEAAEILLKKGVIGIGIDTLSPDRPENGFPVHDLFLSSGKIIIENAAHLSEMPPVGAFIFALPLKTRGTTESAIRLIGII